MLSSKSEANGYKFGSHRTELAGCMENMFKYKMKRMKRKTNTTTCRLSSRRFANSKRSGDDFSVIGYVNRNEKGMATIAQGEWVYVRWDGKEGWVHRSYVANVEQNEQNNQQNNEQHTYVQMLYDNTNIRSAPSTQSPVVAKAKRGDQFSVIRKEGQWYVIQVDAQTIGYVAEWVVQVSNQPSPSQPQSLVGKTIVIDAGHGGKDYGTTGVNGTIEKC